MAVRQRGIAMSIEFLHPGVYLTELPFEAHPIDGVPQSVPTHTPDWTNPVQSDPGMTLIQLLAYTAESLAYRVDLSSVENRYIGETEKNIGAAFGQAQHGNTTLRFDESASLFGDDDPD
jgi:hypothetical protein